MAFNETATTKARKNIYAHENCQKEKGSLTHKKKKTPLEAGFYVLLFPPPPVLLWCPSFVEEQCTGQ